MMLSCGTKYVENEERELIGQYDDLLVLCHGDIKSVKVVKSVMDIFSSISRLRPNIGKSTVFFGNVKDHVKNEMLSILPFKIGSLSVSYLGVPLITKSLALTDCKSILSSMQVYWASVFILPKSVVKEIDKLLKGFLWCQGELSKGKAKVAWKQICRPKDEGGLGIKSLEVWNEVLMSKHLWNVATLKESIWVKWTIMNRVKDDGIWAMKCDKNASHGWNQILSLRDKMRAHIISKIGDGASIFLWHDRWWRPDPITKFIPMDVIRNDGFDSKMKLKDMIYRYMWLTKDDKCVNFSTNRAWRDWREDNAKVDWHKFIWFSNCTPKHSFIMWIAILGRLTTQERLQKWYPEKELTCSYCGVCPDSTNHLFFECCYSMSIWRIMKERAGITNMPNNWDEIMTFMTARKHNRSINSLLRRITLAACVYFIWCERNKRVFNSERRCSKVLIEEITIHLRMKLASLNVKSTKQIEDVCKKWKVKMNAQKGKGVFIEDINKSNKHCILEYIWCGCTHLSLLVLRFGLGMDLSD
ncbi:putative reverse transcriptase domain, reverse transcriptase zinc-binding domain protein [Tanacetum coccineum]